MDLIAADDSNTSMSCNLKSIGINVGYIDGNCRCTIETSDLRRNKFRWKKSSHSHFFQFVDASQQRRDDKNKFLKMDKRHRSMAV